MLWARVEGDGVAAVADSPLPGYAELVELERPADTLAQTWDEVLELVEGRPVRSWSPRAWSVAELQAMPAPRLASLQAAANAETLRDRALSALATNAVYVARAAPTTAQNTAQLKALTMQMSALVRLALGALDSTT